MLSFTQPFSIFLNYPMQTVHFQPK
jgi:hypothetical protein